jgi:BMFP domain-containing protein YqiC
LPEFGALIPLEEKIMDPQIINSLARKLAESVPPGVRAMQEDLERNFRALLSATFARMNLVTREEFEVQQKVLERTREKLAQLEAEIQALQEKPPAGT